MRSINYLYPLLIVIVSCKVKNQLDLEVERSQILRLHHLQRDYHFNKDSISFANLLSENFISVNNGIITHPARNETISKYHTYFSSVDFVQWDDVTEPIIRFSEDAKLAYMIVDKLVKVTHQTESGEKIDSETHFAWTAVYKKYGDEWKIDCVTSTERPTKKE